VDRRILEVLCSWIYITILLNGLYSKYIKGYNIAKSQIESCIFPLANQTYIELQMLKVLNVVNATVQLYLMYRDWATELFLNSDFVLWPGLMFHRARPNCRSENVLFSIIYIYWSDPMRSYYVYLVLTYKVKIDKSNSSNENGINKTWDEWPKRSITPLLHSVYHINWLASLHSWWAEMINSEQELNVTW